MVTRSSRFRTPLAPGPKLSARGARNRGLRDRTSEIRSGKRFIGKVQAKKLAGFFNLEADLFI